MSLEKQSHEVESRFESLKHSEIKSRKETKFAAGCKKKNDADLQFHPILGHHKKCEQQKSRSELLKQISDICSKSRCWVGLNQFRVGLACVGRRIRNMISLQSELYGQINYQNSLSLLLSHPLSHSLSLSRTHCNHSTTNNWPRGDFSKVNYSHPTIF